jgi:hypothetical protein
MSEPYGYPPPPPYGYYPPPQTVFVQQQQQQQTVVSETRSSSYGDCGIIEIIFCLFCFPLWCLCKFFC